MLLRDITPDSNVWEKNPALTVIRQFRKLKEDEGDDRSNAIIKAIFLIWDTKSPLRDSGVSPEQLVEDVSQHLLGDADFNWDPYEEFRDFFIESNISKTEALMLKYEQEIEGLNKLLSNWKWSQKDADKRARIMKEYKSLFEDLAEVRSIVVEQVEMEEELEGGYNKSFLESFGTE